MSRSAGLQTSFSIQIVAVTTGEVEMFNDIPDEVSTRMRELEGRDAADRCDGTPRLERLRQIPPETGRFLALLAASAPPGRYVEIGTSAGYSALWLALACRAAGRRLTTFEVLASKAAFARETFSRANVADVVELVEADFLARSSGLSGISFCFLDGEKESYRACYDAVIPKLVPGGLLVADNAINHRETLQSMLDTALADNRVDALIVPIGKGELVCPLAHLSNRPYGRYRLSCPVSWPYKGDEVAAQATGAAVRYDISYDAFKARWYIDASWSTQHQPIASLDQLRRGPVVAVDLNVGHLAVAVLDCYGNPVGAPTTIPLVLDGLDATTRDARIRDAISQVLAIAAAHHAGAVVVENLDFVAARTEGREHSGNRPSRGRRGRAFRRHISGLPTAKLRERLSQMSYNAGVAVIAVDPAYTSKWGAQHWLDPLRAQYPKHRLTGHHAASVAIGRRGLRQRLRRCGTSAQTPPVDGERATATASDGGTIPVMSAGLPEPVPSREANPRGGRRQPPGACTGRSRSGGSETTMPNSGTPPRRPKTVRDSPAGQDSLLLSDSERWE